MKTLQIKADVENNAEIFWAEFSLAFPAIADQVREGHATIDSDTWETIQSIEGFADGPEYAQHALVVCESGE